MITIVTSCGVRSQASGTKITIGNKTIIGSTVIVDGKGVRQYLGIPYAQMPAKFAAPIESVGWSGTLIATKRKSTCWQPTLGEFDRNNPGARMWGNNTEMDEHCLHLNIWTPLNPQNNKLPVMVWIYGGGFYSGSSYLDVYDGSFLCGTQQVVVVSIQYRVGPLGFLFMDPTKGGPSNPENRDLALGNQGLLDQALALKWIKETIGNFSGDPESITIFGESAGAVSVSMLWLSPHTRGYIKRAILESGSLFTRWGLSSPEDAQARSDKFAKALDCPIPSTNRDGALDCLKKKSPKELTDKIFSVEFCKERETAIKDNLNDEYRRLSNRNYSTCLYFDAPLRPVLYEPLFPRSLEELFNERKKIESELLIGVNKNEGMYFLLYGLAVNNTQFLDPKGEVLLPDILKNPGSQQAQANGEFTTISIGEFLEESLMKSNLATQPADFYKIGKNMDVELEPLMERLDHFTGDLDFICPTLQFADKVSAIPNARVYLYNFAKRTQGFTMPEWLGVMHGYEIEYVFGMPLSQKFQQNFYSFTEDEKQLSRKVMNLWANFAKHGDPNNGIETGDQIPNWPRYDTLSRNYLQINTRITTGQNLRKDACDFWSNLRKQVPANGK